MWKECSEASAQKSIAGGGIVAQFVGNLMAGGFRPFNIYCEKTNSICVEVLRAAGYTGDPKEGHSELDKYCSTEGTPCDSGCCFDKDSKDPDSTYDSFGNSYMPTTATRLAREAAAAGAEQAEEVDSSALTETGQTSYPVREEQEHQPYDNVRPELGAAMIETSTEEDHSLKSADHSSSAKVFPTTSQKSSVMCWDLGMERNRPKVQGTPESIGLLQLQSWPMLSFLLNQQPFFP